MAGVIITVVLLVLLLLVGISYCLRQRTNAGSSLAPGPPSLPLVGHLHLLIRGPDAPHILFMKLARRYGPVMSLRFGSVPILVASTKAAAMEFYKTHDAIFSSRPPSTVGRVLFHGYQDMAFAPYNERWRQLRRLCTLELFTSRRVDSYKSLRNEELGSLLRCLFISQGEVVDMRKRFVTTMFNFICRILIGKRYYDENISKDDPWAAKFIHLMDEVVRLAGTFSIGEYMPYLRWLDLDKVEVGFKSVSIEMHLLLENIVIEHEKKAHSEDTVQAKDFLNLMLELRDQGEECLQQRQGIKSLLINLFGAGSETSSLTLEWGLAELIKHPDCMEKLQNEISQIVGLDRLVSETDIPKLNYLDAVIKETFRLHPPVALLLPHFSTQDCNVMGYRIAKGTTLFVNAYAIGRDPDVWEDPVVFKPERFLGKQIDYRGRDYELLPFGSGRRICPGITMSLSMVYISLANLVHAFKWEMPPGCTVDTINEERGLTVSMAKKLQAIPNARLLNPELY